MSALALLSNAARDGALFRGLLPGLVRSSIANGTSMVVYKKVHAELSRLAGRDDHSNIWRGVIRWCEHGLSGITQGGSVMGANSLQSKNAAIASATS